MELTTLATSLGKLFSSAVTPSRVKKMRINPLVSIVALALLMLPSVAKADGVASKLYTVQVNEPIDGFVVEAAYPVECKLPSNEDLIVAGIDNNRIVYLLQVQGSVTCAGFVTIDSATEEVCGASINGAIDSEWKRYEYETCRSAYTRSQLT